MGGDHTCRSCGQLAGMAHAVGCGRRKYGVLVTTDDVVYDPLAGYYSAAPAPARRRRWTWGAVLFALLIVVLAFTMLTWMLLGDWHRVYEDSSPLSALVAGWLLCDWHNGRA